MSYLYLVASRRDPELAAQAVEALRKVGFRVYAPHEQDQSVPNYEKYVRYTSRIARSDAVVAIFGDYGHNTVAEVCLAKGMGKPVYGWGRLKDHDVMVRYSLKSLSEELGGLVHNILDLI